MTAMLRARGLTKDYGDLLAIEAVDLGVGAGELVALIGHNGSGKTTFLRIAAGLLQATGGEVTVAGHPAGSLGARTACSFLPDTPVLYDDLSMREHVAYVSPLFGGVDEDRAEQLLELMGLTPRADDLPARFSRGLRQKASVVLAFARPYEVLLVDEPFVGLDAEGRAGLLQLLDEARAAGAAVVVATHQLDLLGRATRCVAFRDGQVLYDGAPDAADVEDLVARG